MPLLTPLRVARAGRGSSPGSVRSRRALRATAAATARRATACGAAVHDRVDQQTDRCTRVIRPGHCAAPHVAAPHVAAPHVAAPSSSSRPCPRGPAPWPHCSPSAPPSPTASATSWAAWRRAGFRRPPSCCGRTWSGWFCSWRWRPWWAATSAPGPAVGATAGVLGGGGVALFYRGLAVGPMSVVAPVAAVAVGRSAGRGRAGVGRAPHHRGVRGHPPRARRGGPDFRSRRRRGAGPAVAGTGARSRRRPGVRPVLRDDRLFGRRGRHLAARGRPHGVGGPVRRLGAARITASGLPRGAAGAAVGCGILDASANVFYVLALDHGLLSVVSVLTALYPAGTDLLARYVLGERLSTVQRRGWAWRRWRRC